MGFSLCCSDWAKSHAAGRDPAGTQPDPHSKLLCEGLVADNDLIQPKLMGALGYFTFSKHVKAKLNFEVVKFIQIYADYGIGCKSLFQSAVFVQFLHRKELARIFIAEDKEQQFSVYFHSGKQTKNFIWNCPKMLHLTQCYNMGKLIQILVKLRCIWALSVIVGNTWIPQQIPHALPD